MLFRDLRSLIYLFIALRVMLLIVFQPELVNGVERGLSTLGDFQEHYTLASQINSENLPYRDYWVEFPPLWIGLAALLAQFAQNFTAWASLMYLLLLAVDTGNLILLHRLGERLYDAETGFSLAWTYALLAAPLIMLGWNFENLVLFTILGGLYFYLTQQDRRSGILLAVGILAKYVPVLLLPTIWKFAPRQQAIMHSAVVLILVALVLVPLMFWGGDMAIQSLTVQFDKPSYQTIWALIDGNYGTGSFPTGAERYDANWSFGATPQIPPFLRLIPFALLGAWLFWQPLEPTEQNQLRFFTITLSLFMLWSQGWSPQWSVLLVPFILLNFPDRIGVLLSLALMLGAFMEYPMLFRQTADTGNVIAGKNENIFILLVISRTIIIAVITFVLSYKLKERPHALSN